MGILKACLHFLNEYKVDLIFAVVFAIIADTLRVGSIVRAGGRRIKNKLSERSAARLRKRIAQLETYRNRINSYASSDKALYLNMFQTVLVVLIFMCMGAIVSILSLLQGLSAPNELNPVYLFPIILFALAIAVAASALKIAVLDSRSKISALVAELDSEIANLRQKLNAYAEK